MTTTSGSQVDDDEGAYPFDDHTLVSLLLLMHPAVAAVPYDDLVPLARMLRAVEQRSAEQWATKSTTSNGSGTTTPRSIFDGLDDDLLARINGSPHARKRLADLLAAEEARAFLAEITEARSTLPAPDVALLGEILRSPRTVKFRIDGLLPTGGRMLLSAQRKVGKTTTVGNVARALLTGDRLFGRFGVKALDKDERIVLLNYEVGREQIGEWLDDLGVDRDRVVVITMRGTRNLLATERGRDELVRVIREHNGQVLIVDPFGRAFSGRSQNDVAEVTPWLALLDEVAERAGCSEVVLVAHTGWDGERTRGSTALEDWPDSIVRLTKDADGQRFLSAEGRDVDVPEDRLDYDPDTRRLTMTGSGGRVKQRHDALAEKVSAEVLAIVKMTPGIGAVDLQDKVQESVTGVANGLTATVAKGLAKAGALVRVREGRSCRHWLPQDAPDRYRVPEVGGDDA